MKKKLGKKNAALVLKAFASNEQQFGSIKVSLEELSELTPLYAPKKMLQCRDVYAFRAGTMVIMLVIKWEWIDITIINPYTSTKQYSTSIY